jgi:cysteine dioxygenase
MEYQKSEMFTDEKLVVPPKNLEELIKELHKIFSYDRVNVEYVKALLSAYKSNPKDWKKYAKFDPHRYTRHLVDEGNGKFNLMILCWGEGHGSSIHDHANAHCFVKMLDGKLQETLFDWPSDSEDETEMRQLGISVCGKDGVAYINDEMGLHRMENPSHSEQGISMHLYSPPFASCKTFDQKTGHENTVHMTFWSKYGQKTTFGVKNGSSGQCMLPEPENN